MADEANFPSDEAIIESLNEGVGNQRPLVPATDTVPMEALLQPAIEGVPALPLRVLKDGDEKWVYYVFVRGCKIFRRFTWHTELRICIPRVGITRQQQEELDSFSGEITQDQQQHWKDKLDCRNTGFPYIELRLQSFDDNTMYHFGSPQGPYKGGYLMHAGKLEIGKADNEESWDPLKKWVLGMSVCGQWLPQHYRMLSHNCNSYTQAALESFSLRGLDKIFEEAELGNTVWPNLIERGMFSSFLTGPGNFDIKLQTCIGTRCTIALDEAPSDVSVESLRLHKQWCPEGSVCKWLSRKVELHCAWVVHTH